MTASRVDVGTAVMDGRDEAEKQIQLMVKSCEVNVNRIQMTMAQTQMPRKELHSMSLVYEWDIRDVETTAFGYHGGRRESEVFPLTGYHYGAKATISSRGEFMLQFINYCNTKRPVDPKSIPRFTCIFPCQSQDTQDKQLQNSTQLSADAIRTEFISFDESVDYEKYIGGCSSFLLSKFVHPPYLVSKCMKLRLYIEPPSIARSFFSNDGILLWRMDNYKERRQMQEDGLVISHESPYFYTSPQGYRVIIRLSLREENVWAWLRFLKGEFDSSLTLEFPHRFTMTIFNRTDESKNLVLSHERKWANCTQLCFETSSASFLESGGYVADDSLLIKAVVEPL